MLTRTAALQNSIGALHTNISIAQKLALGGETHDLVGTSTLSLQHPSSEVAIGMMNGDVVMCPDRLGLGYQPRPCEPRPRRSAH